MKEKIYTIPVTDAFREDCECPLCTLEKKLEEGVFIREDAGVRTASASGKEDRGKPAASRPEPAPPAKKAAPEDLKLIKAHWKEVVGQTESLLRGVLSRAGAPRYDSSTGEARLYLQASDPITLMRLNRPEQIDELKKIIAKTIHKDLEYGIEIVGTILFAPTVFETGTILHI